MNNKKIYQPECESNFELNVKSSKFIAYCFPVTQLEEIELKIKDLKKEHFKARHHCYAYRLGITGELYRANDDGEPSGSAGLPIYNQIRSCLLSNVLVVVVRYFGGTLLGISGLTKAYKDASANLLKKVKKQPLIAQQIITIEINYADINNLMQLLQDINAKIIKKDIAMRCKYTIELPLEKIADLKQNNNLIKILYSN